MIAIGCDHGGYDLKEVIVAHLKEKNYEVKDCGCYSKESCDYPEFGRAVAKAVAAGECEKGILICTTGIGISITANKVKGIRAALCADPLSAELTRLHNNANVLALGAGMTGPMLAKRIVDVFLETAFSEEERHQRRIDGIEE
ncbi:MAG: ribose 5-phosphate isomerase B [Lachnospiraceae bacterium]|nr:ribose 5-phosphate isomerase B [Lachnospiraceae bacterium]